MAPVPTVAYQPAGHDAFRCSVVSPRGLWLELAGTLADVEPSAEGDQALTENLALRHNAWAYAKHEKLHRKLRAKEKKASHRKQADSHRKTAAIIAALVDLRGSNRRDGWCSACFARTAHTRLVQGFGRVPAYLCDSCGSPTLTCAAPRCAHMATRGSGPIALPRYCAEHRHDIPGFEKSTSSISRLEDYEGLLTFEKSDLSRGSRVTVGVVMGAGAIAMTAGMAAPAIGGAVGSFAGLSGAAATSYGLAALGGGSLAAGGLGMAGGTMVVTATGGALGSALGFSITSSYVSDDKSFRIEQLRGGDGPPVIVANGFLTESSDTWAGWRPMIERRYPDSPVYRIHWGAKELRAFAALLGWGVGRAGAAAALKQAASRASRKAAAKAGPLSPVLLAADLAKNPWHTSKVRADRTGVALAGILARTTPGPYVLVGHSLGARVMATAAMTLASAPQAPPVSTVHLLGAALGSKGDWRALDDAVTDAVYNYYSTRDDVLKRVYRVVQGGQTAAGYRGLRSTFPRIKDRDVSRRVATHSDYFSHVRLA
ncbi:MAG: DUF726 domain-containing protein [Patulibacter sp.]|nr:DUF726 domain-containing protein [Patulibacter sp.]